MVARSPGRCGQRDLRSRADEHSLRPGRFRGPMGRRPRPRAHATRCARLGSMCSARRCLFLCVSRELIGRAVVNETTKDDVLSRVHHCIGVRDRLHFLHGRLSVEDVLNFADSEQISGQHQVAWPWLYPAQSSEHRAPNRPESAYFGPRCMSLVPDGGQLKSEFGQSCATFTDPGRSRPDISANIGPPGFRPICSPKSIV